MKVCFISRTQHNILCGSENKQRIFTKYLMSSTAYWYLTFQSLPVTWCTNSLTFNNCTFCPHCIYVFFIYLITNSDCWCIMWPLSFEMLKCSFCSLAVRYDIYTSLVAKMLIVMLTPNGKFLWFSQSCSHWAKFLSLSPVVVTLICLSAMSLCPSRALHILHSKLYLYAGNKDWQNGTVQLRGTDGAWGFMGLSHVRHEAIQRVKNVWRTDLRRSSASLCYLQPAATGRTLQ